jgi:ribosomal protein S18 acetylase RimI-like enzyme
MIKAQVNDKALVIAILSQAFDDNSSVNYIIRQNNKNECICALMDYSFEVCMMFGEVWLSNDRKACALIIYPEHKRTSIKSIWLDVKLILFAVGLDGVFKALKREGLIKKKQPEMPMTYLWFIGVKPLYKQQGIGSKLLKELMADAQQKNRPVFLETSTLKNLPWYERFGFRIYDQLELSYTLYFLNNLPV